jgi:hypothetical protein
MTVAEITTAIVLAAIVIEGTRYLLTHLGQAQAQEQPGQPPGRGAFGAGWAM